MLSPVLVPGHGLTMVPVLMELTGQPEPEDDGARMVIQGQETPVFKVAATRDARAFVGANSS